MVILASASPRRKELLALLVNDFEVFPANIDETPHVNEKAGDYVLRMAKEKAITAAQKYQQSFPNHTAKVFVASDTSVVVEDEILGKPSDLADAKRMLSLLSGRSHQVMTSICLCDLHGTHLVLENIVTQVTFRPISDLEIEHYWYSGEPKDKAGAYAIQGKGSVFVSHMTGSYSAVVGLPLYETAQLLAQFGVHALEESINE
ncbi:Maf family protein [Marinomonas epiphytica]